MPPRAPRRASRSSPSPIPTARAAALVAGKLGVSGPCARSARCWRRRRCTGSIVCTPAEQHEEATALAAQAGLTALVEKPPAPDAAGALRLAALQPAPWIAFNRRFDQGLELTRRVPPGGDLALRMVLHYRRDSWRPVQRGDDALLDLGPHLIDLALFLTRSLPLAVRAHATRDRAGLVLATTRAEVQIECATDRPHHELVEVRSAGGRLLGPHRQRRPRARRAGPADAGRAPARALAHAPARGLRPRAARRGSRSAGDRRGGRRGHARARRRAPLGRRRRRDGRRRGRHGRVTARRMICVLQFDAASVAVVDRMLAAGRLPVLAGLIERGGGWTLDTPADHFAAGAFHTLYSGVELADHGLFYPFQWDAGAQRARYMTAFPAPPAIWERLARAGLRTLAIDPYESRPPQRLARDVRLRLGLSRPRRAAALVAAAGGRRAARGAPRREPARDGDLRPPDRARAARAAREARRRAGAASPTPPSSCWAASPTTSPG